MRWFIGLPSESICQSIITYISCFMALSTAPIACCFTVSGWLRYPPSPVYMAILNRLAPYFAVFLMDCSLVYCPNQWRPWLLMPCKATGSPSSLQSCVPFTCSQPFSLTPPDIVSTGPGSDGPTGWPSIYFSARMTIAQASARVRPDFGLKRPLSSPANIPQEYPAKTLS